MSLIKKNNNNWKCIDPLGDIIIENDTMEKYSDIYLSTSVTMETQYFLHLKILHKCKEDRPPKFTESID